MRLHVFAALLGTSLLGAGTFAIAAGSPQLPTATSQTYAAAGSAAVSAMEARWYVSGAGWRNCLYSKYCRTSDNDWGADSLTYTMYDRWHNTHDASLVPTLNDLGSHLIGYPDAGCAASTTCSWSDVPLWDSVAAGDTYLATGNAALLEKAQDAFDYVDTSPSAFNLGACPSIVYQIPYGGTNYLKTLESDSNYVKAALLLYLGTHNATYLDKAVAKYSAIRRYFLDPQLSLYTVYVFDQNGSCTQVPRRFYASVNGNMIWNGLNLYNVTDNATYLNDATATTNAVITHLNDANGVHADLQAENDVEQPLVTAMHDMAKTGHTGARNWVLKNAAAAINAMLPDGSFGRFWDGPVTPGMDTEFQTNGGFSLMIAAADIGGDAAIPISADWTGATYVTRTLNTNSNSNSLTFTGAKIAFTGTIGDVCCESGHARVYIDGVETTDGTGIWQNKSSTSIRLHHSILFAWQWPTVGTHTIAFGPGVRNGKEGGSYLNVDGFYVK